MSATPAPQARDQVARLLTLVPYLHARDSVRLAEAAVALVRHHRLIERFLVQTLGYDWDDVHEEADRLEHARRRKISLLPSFAGTTSTHFTPMAAGARSAHLSRSAQTRRAETSSPIPTGKVCR